MPHACVLLFGQEGPGLSEAALSLAGVVLSITQTGSTRSINVAAAAAIAMHVWQSQHGVSPAP
jgi:tRNA G18 (ribose-2'-O)-methylase SpoU